MHKVQKKCTNVAFMDVNVAICAIKCAFDARSNKRCHPADVVHGARDPRRAHGAFGCVRDWTDARRPVLWWRSRARVRFATVDGTPAGALVEHLPTLEDP